MGHHTKSVTPEVFSSSCSGQSVCNIPTVPPTKAPVIDKISCDGNVVCNIPTPSSPNVTLKIDCQGNATCRQVSPTGVTAHLLLQNLAFDYAHDFA